MRSVFAAHPSPDDPLAALRLDDRPAPEVPDGHVAVNVRAASVNMHDIFTPARRRNQARSVPHDPRNGWRRDTR